MQHHFNVEIATKYGVNVAIFLDHLSFWIVKNVSNNKHFHDGYYWTYNSVEAYGLIFPYMKPRSIRTMIEQCLKDGLIIKGNYNSNPYDRTSWYALMEKAEKLLNLSICQKRQMETSPLTNEFVQTDKSSYTDIEPYINTYIKYRAPKTKKRKVLIDCPESFKPSPENYELGQKLGIDVDEELPKFLSCHKSKGTKFQCWHMAFNTWLYRKDEFKAKSFPSTKKESHSTTFNTWCKKGIVGHG